MKEEKTKEPQYEVVMKGEKNYGPVKLGLMTSHLWRSDPKHLGFLLARYKFVAKMLSGCKKVLEIGCGDGFGAQLVLQEVDDILATDFDPIFIENCKKERETSNLKFQVVDLTKEHISPKKDAVYALDVLEHIKKEDEDVFLKNIILSLTEKGICIIGMPSLESQIHASKWSKMGHVNCKTGSEFKKFMRKYFDNVFLFSMNDEVVHTGFYPMAHYLIVLATNPKKIDEL